MTMMTILLLIILVIVAPVLAGLFLWMLKKMSRSALSLEDAILQCYELAYPKNKL